MWKAKEEESREKHSRAPRGNRFGQRDPDFLARARAQDVAP